MIAKIVCLIFGHDFWMPSDKHLHSLLGGICKRCLRLTSLEVPKATGSIVMFKRYD